MLMSSSTTRFQFLHVFVSESDDISPFDEYKISYSLFQDTMRVDMSGNTDLIKME